MGFGYKTSWLGVRGATVAEVADALALGGRREVGWTEGTEAAYREGVYVAGPVDGWTLAHGRVDLTPGRGPEGPDFPDWLLALAARLGDLQFFCTDRVGDCHAWAKVEEGRLVRAYCYHGAHGDVPFHLGEPTPVERESGVGTRWLEDGWEEWEESDWDEWHAAMPNEQDVMTIARDWGICPLDIPDDDALAGPGVHGFPAGGRARR
ncbi:hypothetical protein ACQPXS_05990 [Streptomyces sp. CA-142005]|uniref:hypothetical protein n=1 Tax=Streptomyces sp. CA-142005 TaxID=3240052 RepID=UPI003D92EE78